MTPGAGLRVVAIEASVPGCDPEAALSVGAGRPDNIEAWAATRSRFVRVPFPDSRIPVQLSEAATDKSNEDGSSQLTDARNGVWCGRL